MVMRSLPVNDGVLTKAAPEASIASLQARTRERWRQLLDIHARHSSAATSVQPGSSASHMRQHALKCSRQKELHDLCCEYLVTTKDFIQQVSYVRGVAHATGMQNGACKIGTASLHDLEARREKVIQ